MCRGHTGVNNDVPQVSTGGQGGRGWWCCGGRGEGGLWNGGGGRGEIGRKRKGFDVS